VLPAQAKHRPTKDTVSVNDVANKVGLGKDRGKNSDSGGSSDADE
jgi:hypothetical protein